MASQRVQIAGLEPSSDTKPTLYAVQIRGIDSDGNPGPWSRELIFQSLTQIPAEIEDVVDVDVIDISANDILLYNGTTWIGSQILFDGTLINSNGSVPFSGPVESPAPQEPEHLANKEYVDAQTKSFGTILASSGVSEINFPDSQVMLEHQILGSVSYSVLAYEIGKTIIIRIINDSGGTATLTFPGWVFVGPQPSDIADGKQALLTLHSFGLEDASCIASYSVQA
jgi:hypothetical protein